jgi:RNA polymerase sigma factor (sigma-70 family)
LSDDRRLQETLERLHGDRAAEDAWADLFREIWPFVLTITYRSLRGDKDAAEDAAQDTFLRLVAYGRFSKGTTAMEFRAYVATIAKRVCANYVTRQRTYGRVSLEEIEEKVPAALGDQAAEFEKDALFQEILDSLPRKDRQFFAWIVEGYTLSDIAELTRRPYGSVGTQLFRLRRRLRRLFPNYAF